MRVSGEGSLTGGNELAGHVVVGEFTPNAALQALLRARGAADRRRRRARRARARHALRYEPRLRPRRAARLQADGARRDGQRHARRRCPASAATCSAASSRRRASRPTRMAKAFAALLPPNLAAERARHDRARRDASTFDAGADTLTVQPLRAEAFGLRMSGDVTARNVSRAATWTGTANVAQFSPQELLQRFGLPPQPTSDPQAFTRATRRHALHGHEGRRGARRPRARARRDDDQGHVRAARLRRAGVSFRARRRRRRRRPLLAAESARRASRRSRRPATSSCRRTTR